MDAERPAVMINAKRIKPPFGPLAGEMAWLIKVHSTKTDDLSLPSTHKLWLIQALYSRETTGELKYCTGLPFLPAASCHRVLCLCLEEYWVVIRQAQ